MNSDCQKWIKPPVWTSEPLLQEELLKQLRHSPLNTKGFIKEVIPVFICIREVEMITMVFMLPALSYAKGKTYQENSSARRILS